VPNELCALVWQQQVIPASVVQFDFWKVKQKVDVHVA
jgi:hypothetical protein